MSRTTLLAAVAIAVLGAVLFMIRKQRYTDQVTGGYLVSVVIIAQEVAEGTQLAPPHVERLDLPPAQVEARHVLLEDINKIFGIPARHTLRAGQALRWTDLRANAQEIGTPSELLEPGTRAVTIYTGYRSFYQMMSRGDRVDVFYTGPTQRPRDNFEQVPYKTVVLAQNVLVLSDEVTMVERDGATRAARQVTLAGSPEEAALLEHSDREGTRSWLSFAARNPDDEIILDDPPTAENADLIEAAVRPPRRTRTPPSGPRPIEQIL